MRKNFLKKTVLAALIGFSAVLTAASGGVIYTESFTPQANEKTPVNWSYSSNWSIVDRGGQAVYRGGDASTTGYYSSAFGFSGLDFSGAEQVEFTFDLRIENYTGLTAGAAGTFRVTLQPNASASQYSIGLGYANVGGSNTLFFYGGNGGAPVPSASNAIGYTPANGFEPGFNLGAMGSGATNGTGGNSYRFKLTLDMASGQVSIMVTNNANPSQTAVFTDQMGPIALDGQGRLIFTTGVASTGNMEVSTLQVASIPEPSTAALAGMSFVSLAFCGMRRKR